ncbi:hypothetical protein C8R43DRAFT_959596 [Mycena crocata]|nr:hypothetical protein C8R43DRAFT_959596 [Mycena crocata]
MQGYRWLSAANTEKHASAWGIGMCVSLAVYLQLVVSFEANFHSPTIGQIRVNPAARPMGNKSAATSMNGWEHHLQLKAEFPKLILPHTPMMQILLYKCQFCSCATSWLETKSTGDYCPGNDKEVAEDQELQEDEGMREDDSEIPTREVVEHVVTKKTRKNRKIKAAKGNAAPIVSQWAREEGKTTASAERGGRWKQSVNFSRSHQTREVFREKAAAQGHKKWIFGLFSRIL